MINSNKEVLISEYAYHTEPYTASQAISRVFTEDELCELGSLQMMKPANVYIMVQKRSPYRQFFVWRLVCMSRDDKTSVIVTANYFKTGFY